MNNIHILHLIADCIIDPLRINHSCSPNVVWSWVAASGGYEVKEVRAVRRIEAGEELCANYIDSFQVRASAWTLSQYCISRELWPPRWTGNSVSGSGILTALVKFVLFHTMNLPKTTK